MSENRSGASAQVKEGAAQKANGPGSTPRVESNHLYPIDIPALTVNEGLDFLLLELPPRYMPMMPNGLAYVDRILRNSGASSQTIDVNIAMYHRYHQDRLLLGTPPFDVGRPVHVDPWDNTMLSEWNRDDFLDHFWPEIEAMLASIVRARPKAVGISANGCNRHVVKRFVAALRLIAPEVLIVIGGYDCVYATVAPKLVTDFDYMVIGEAENSLPALLKAIQANERPGNLKGMLSAFDLPGSVFEPCELPQNLDIDFPQYEWVSHELYQTHDKHHLVPITASRGCKWGKCRFCAECFPFRKRSPSNVVDEIEYWTKRYLHTFHFNESDVNGDHANLYDICSQIIERNLSVSLVGQLRIDRRNTPEYFKHLAKAGFKHLRFGVDGWSKHTLLLQNKGYTVDIVRDNIKACAESGIYTTVNIVIGVPGETEDDITESIECLTSLKEYISQVESLNTLILAAGSEYMRNPEKYNIEFKGGKEEVLAKHPYFIPVDLWHSTAPYIDHGVRVQRLNRFCVELHANGVRIGAFAQKIVDSLLSSAAQ